MLRRTDYNKRVICSRLQFYFCITERENFLFDNVMILIADIMILCFVITLWTRQRRIFCISLIRNETKPWFNCPNP